MINLMTCLNEIGKNGEGKKFIKWLISYVDNKVKGDSYKNNVLSKWWT